MRAVVPGKAEAQTEFDGRVMVGVAAERINQIHPGIVSFAKVLVVK